ncbi:unnamed protein product [Allacma fusca]|uniref:Uncharacterized protein n=1 Tax=Allacma fusca TaxID=39272 RepID=A0A8J2Q2N9_9HEXA|nr:unnamed protein product [Allacma fusca]
MASPCGDTYQNSGRRVAYGDGYADTRHLREQPGNGDREVHKSIYDSRHSVPSEYETNLQSRPPQPLDPNSKFGHTYRNGRISYFNQERNEAKNLSSKFLIYGGSQNPSNEDFHRDNAYYRNPQPSQSFPHASSESRERLKDNLDSRPKNATESFWTIYQENPNSTQTTYSKDGKFYPERANHINRPEDPHFYEDLLKQYKSKEEKERLPKPPHHEEDDPDRYDFPTTNNKTTARAPNAVIHGWPNRWNDRRFLEMARRFPPPSSHNFSPRQIKMNRAFPSNSSYNSGSRPSLMDWISSSSRNSLVDQMYLNSASKNSLNSQPNNGPHNSNNSFLSPAKVQNWKHGHQLCPNPSDTITKYRDTTFDDSTKHDQHYSNIAPDSPYGDGSRDPSSRKSQSLLFSPSSNGSRQIQVVNPPRNRPTNTYFPAQTSETHASFKNPLELTRKFHTNQAPMEIPIIPRLTESQASYQNPHEPRKLPLGYPDKNTSHFVRSSLTSMRRDQRNNDEQEKSFPPSHPPPSRLLHDPKSNYSLNPVQSAMLEFTRSRSEMAKRAYQSNYNNISSSSTTALPPQVQQHPSEERGAGSSPRHDTINNNRDTSNLSFLERKQDQAENHFSREPSSSSRLHIPRNASGDYDNNREWHQQNYFPRDSKEKNFDRFNTSPHQPPPLMNSTRQEGEVEEDAGSRGRYPPWNSPERIYLSNESTPRKCCENNHERSPGPAQHERNERMKQEEDRESKNYSRSQVTTESLERHSGNPLRTNISVRANLSTKTTMNAEAKCQNSSREETPSSKTLKTSTGTGTRLIRHPELRPAETSSNRPPTSTPFRQRMSFRDDNYRGESVKPSRSKQVGRLKPILKRPRSQRNQTNPQPIEDSLKYVPLKIMLFCKKGIMSIPSPSDVVPNSNSFSRPTELITPKKGSSLASGDQRRHRFTVSMDGFFDEDIYFFMDKSKTKLVVEGRRPKRENINAKRLVETIELPKGLSPDNLRVARDFKGILHFEEAWVF